MNYDRPLYTSRVIAPEAYSMTDVEVNEVPVDEQEALYLPTVYVDAHTIIVSRDIDNPWICAISRNGAFSGPLSRMGQWELRTKFDKDFTAPYQGDTQIVDRNTIAVKLYCPMPEPEDVPGRADPQYPLALAHARITFSDKTRWLFVA